MVAVTVIIVLLALRVFATTLPPPAPNETLVGAFGAVVSTTTWLLAESSVAATVNDVPFAEDMTPPPDCLTMPQEPAGQMIGVLFVRSALVCPVMTTYRNVRVLVPDPL